MLPGHVTGDESVEFVVGPTLGEEGGREHDDAETARPDPFIDLAAEAVADPHLGFVEPDSHAQLGKRISKGAGNSFLVLGRVGDEDVPGLSAKHVARRLLWFMDRDGAGRIALRVAGRRQEARGGGSTWTDAEMRPE